MNKYLYALLCLKRIARKLITCCLKERFKTEGFLFSNNWQSPFMYKQKLGRRRFPLEKWLLE